MTTLVLSVNAALATTKKIQHRNLSRTLFYEAERTRTP